MTDRDTDIILARFEGILKAFGWFNTKTNHGCNFAIHTMSKAADVPSALGGYFKLSSSNFRVEPLEEFERELRDVFSRFLFLFREPVEGHEFGDYLVDPRRSFNLMDDWGRDDLLNEMTAIVRSLGTSAAWRVTPTSECGELREWCFQEDVVVELPERLCLLHFGVSD